MVKATYRRKQREPDILDFKIKGDFMKPFLPFYDPGSLEVPIGKENLEKMRKKLYEEIKTAVRYLRSSYNLNT